ncbi:hypothetical protein FRC19_002078 [Serendipita sp. 401]|nr:hypothetical protein FRC19_002078 [Serendipita sp. 401]KAG9055142.1 hypothetical protein FS842_003039 [Serendipita sp. 407]
MSSKIGTKTAYRSPYTEQLKQEETAFVIGEDDDDDQERVDETNQPQAQEETLLAKPESQSEQNATETQPMDDVDSKVPSKYWLRKGDTLHGIALRFKLNSREICKLNNLPPSTLSTTPHLLHTRSFIILRPATQEIEAPSPEAEERARRRKNERAAKQFQFVTKELDWRIAKTYVDLAEDQELGDDYEMKRKEAGLPIGRPDRETSAAGAVQRYLDDEEWEQEQLKSGAKPRIAPFPFVTKA